MSDTKDQMVQPGSEVVMRYRITLEDGTVADATAEGEFLDFTMGDGTLIEGLEMALYGVSAGERQTLTIGPENAFGLRDESRIHAMARSEFAADLTLEPGVIIEFTTPGGDAVPGMIREVRDDEVVVDFNHPLAGHTITFDVEIVSVKPATMREE